MSDVTQGQSAPANAIAVAADAAAAAGVPADGAPAPVTNGTATAATTATTAAVSAEPPKEQAYWPADWRQKAAEHYAAGDKDALAKELRRLERISDPVGLYGMYREAEGKLTSGGLLRVPGKDAKPEDIAEFHKQLGVPEKPEDYFTDLKLANDAVIGDADKPIFQEFAAEIHKAGATPQVMSAVANWYYARQQKQADALDEADDAHRRESLQALRDEWGGPAQLKANQAAIRSLFDMAEGGTDINNPQAVYHRLMGGRTADGKIIGNDPAIAKWLAALGIERNPMPTLVEGGEGSSMGIDTEITSIEKRMREDRPGYFKDEKLQARYRTLLETRDRIRARA